MDKDKDTAVMQAEGSPHYRPILVNISVIGIHRGRRDKGYCTRCYNSCCRARCNLDIAVR